MGLELLGKVGHRGTGQEKNKTIGRGRPWEDTMSDLGGYATRNELKKMILNTNDTKHR